MVTFEGCVIQGQALGGSTATEGLVAVSTRSGFRLEVISTERRLIFSDSTADNPTSNPQISSTSTHATSAAETLHSVCQRGSFVGLFLSMTEGLSCWTRINQGQPSLIILRKVWQQFVSSD